MDCHDKKSDENMAILMLIGLTVSHNKLPFVIGDWPLTPQGLAAMSWLHTIDGYIVATDEVTCFQEGRNTEGSVIDYAVVSNLMAPMVDYIRVLDDWAYRPHKYVELMLKIEPDSICEWQVWEPRSFPDERPIGPHN